MGIPLNLDFEMGVAKPIDSRLVMTKAQMLAANDATMPQVYGCWCTEDGKPYIYNKNNTVDSQLGRFRQAPDAQDLVDISLQNAAFSQYSSAFADIYAKLDNIEKTLKATKDVYIETGVEVASDFQYVFLPDHEKSYFCNETTLEFKATYSQTGTESIVVNGQTIALQTEHEANVEVTENIHIINEFNVVNVYEGSTLIYTLPNDTFILTFGIVGTNLTSGVITQIERNYEYYDYLNIKIASKNGYAISEKYDGTIEYWNRRVVRGGGPKYTDCQHSFSAHHTRAVYTTGNISGSLYYFFCTAWNDSYYNETQAGRPVDYTVDREGLIEYIYCSGWDFSNTTDIKQPFWFTGNTQVSNLYKQNREYIENHLKKVDLSNVKFGDAMSSSDAVPQVSIVSLANNKSVGNLTLLGNYVKKYPKYSRLRFDGNYSLETLGDLSDWDVTNIIQFNEMLSYDMNLAFIGDIGKWKIGHNDSTSATAIKNMFRICCKLKGISSALSDWNTSKCTAMNGIFQGALCIGDNTLASLWKWDVSNVTNFGEMFAYLTPVLTNGWVAERYAPDNIKHWGTLCNEYQDANTTEARKEEIEWELAEFHKSIIVEKRTDLSFVEKWDMSKATQTRDMFAYNPYLVNVGDLRNWQLNPSNTWTELGASGMFAYCTSLETLKLPSFPNGVNVDKIVKGCTSLANVELNALNVDAISFIDCPLTKQSVLNLINAATTDVTITLKSDIYSNMIADSDVQSAIAAKGGDNITVTLATI